jgi:hypothetical protein
MIRFILEPTVSRRDVNGNTYGYCVVTSTKTGHWFAVDCSCGCDPSREIASEARRAGFGDNEVYECERVMHNVFQYRQGKSRLYSLEKMIPAHDRDRIREMLREIEQD